MSKVFVVMGCHRSATSLVAKALFDQGIDMGSPLLEATPDQPHGHYEHVPLIRLNDTLLSHAGGTWDDPPSRTAVESLNVDDAARYVASRAGDMWGMKDPRMVVLWPVWRRALEGHDVHVLPIMRRCEHVAASLTARDGPADWCGLWQRYHTDLMLNLTEWSF